MEKVYNAKLSFKGDGNFSFVLPNYGELTIYKNRDIYVKGLTVNGVEALRQLRPLLLEHQLNAKPDGCFRVIDLNTMSTKVKALENRIQAATNIPVSVSDLKASLIKNEGLIPVDDKKNDDITIYNPPTIDDEVERIKKELEGANQNNKKDEPKLEHKKDKKDKKQTVRRTRRK